MDCRFHIQIDPSLKHSVSMKLAERILWEKGPRVKKNPWALWVFG